MTVSHFETVFLEDLLCAMMKILDDLMGCKQNWMTVSRVYIVLWWFFGKMFEALGG